jgi:hypothetical protein
MPNETDEQQNDEQQEDEQQEDDELASLPENARQLVAFARSQAATRRRELRVEREARLNAEKELAEFRQASESDQERLIREAEQRGFERAAPLVLDAEMAIAAAGKMRDPRVASRLVSDALREELLAITDGNARAARAAEIVEELLEAHPYMAVDDRNGQQGTSALVTQGGRSEQPGRGATNPDDWLRSRAGRK